MSPKLRQEVLSFRKRGGLPWHSPPHRNSDRTDAYLFTAACFNHVPIVGHSVQRLESFERSLLETARQSCRELIAWVVLPNHYHFLARTPDCKTTLSALGQLHGRTSYRWNGEENWRGRKVWFNATETAMKSDRHFWGTVNYIHHNPVKHGYVESWLEWPFSSAASFLERWGREEAAEIWREYPVDEYGAGWDEL